MVDAVVDEIFEVLDASAKGDYIGEPISQLDHCLQAAALAQESSTNSIVPMSLTWQIGPTAN